LCGCEPGFVCSRCAGTPQDYRYFQDPDPEDVERDRRERAEMVDLQEREPSLTRKR